MVEPPRQLRRGAVFEIDDHIFSGPKLIVIDPLSGLMGQALVFDLSG
jgi:hypothetical protein